MPHQPLLSKHRPGVPWQLFDPADLATYNDLYRRWFENNAQAWQEIVEIALDRLQQGAAVWAKFASCRNPKDFAEWQREIAVDTATHVAEDAAKLSQKITNLWENSVKKDAA